jgi:hypothetical protein
LVPNDHPWRRLKRALDWEKITSVMIKHWRAAGKHVDGGRGWPWPAPLEVPWLVLMWLESWPARQMEKDTSERVVARRFLDLTAQQLLPGRDHARMARAAAALGAQGQAELHALRINPARELTLGLRPDSVIGPHGAGTLDR